jgi:hypothetical protein
MPDCPTHKKFPEGSTDREYDVFEELPDGSTIWRSCVSGMEKAELRLRDLSRETTNKFFAVNLQDRTLPEIRPLKAEAVANRQLRHAG